MSDSVLHRSAAEQAVLDEAFAQRNSARREQTAARLEANRQNAQQSAGPRTDEGKAKSSANALKHGVYASSLTPVPRGPLAEDPEEIARFTSAILATLQPTNPVATGYAREIANILLKRERLDRLEAERLAGAARIPQQDTESDDQLIERWEHVADLLRRDPLLLTNDDWRAVVKAIAFNKGEIETLERLTTFSETDLQGLASVQTQQYWASADEAAEYFAQLAAARRKTIADHKALREEQATEKAALELLDGGTFDKLSLVGGRLSKQLERAHAEFEWAQGLNVETNPTAD